MADGDVEMNKDEPIPYAAAELYAHTMTRGAQVSNKEVLEQYMEQMEHATAISLQLSLVPAAYDCQSSGVLKTLEKAVHWRSGRAHFANFRLSLPTTSLSLQVGGLAALVLTPAVQLYRKVPRSAIVSSIATASIVGSTLGAACIAVGTYQKVAEGSADAVYDRAYRLRYNKGEPQGRVSIQRIYIYI